MALKDSLLAHWAFEADPNLVPVHDLSGNNNHLFYTPSAPTPSGQHIPFLTPGIIGNGVHNQSPYDALITQSEATHGGQPFTVAFWYKPVTLVNVAGGAIIFDKLEYTVRIRVSTFFYIQVEFEPDSQFLSVNVPLEIGQWYFITFGYYTDNGSYLWASVNLSERLRVLKTPLASFPATSWIVGSSDTGGDVRGVYDEAAVWSRNVSANELRQIYNKGKGLAFEDWDKVPSCKTVECCDGQ